MIEKAIRKVIDRQHLDRAEMGGRAEKLVADSITALAKRDVDLAQQVIALDPSIDNLQREIEEKAILTIARRQPMAVDLRDIVGALRVSNDLERIGDLAKNIAKRVMALDNELHPVKLIDRQLKLASCFAGWIRQSELFELAAPQVLPIVNFRVKLPDVCEQERRAAHEAIVHEVTRDGRRWISTTLVNGHSVIRMMVISYLTAHRHLEELMIALTEAVRKHTPGN